MKKNIFETIPDSLPEELIETLVSKAGVRIERIVSRGHRSSEGFWYCDEREEFVILLSGSARLLFEDKECSLKPGDYIFIPSLCKHRVEETSKSEDSVWLAVYL